MWWPTLGGWAVLALVTLAPVLAWWIFGESFLATTQRQEADVLVVEGWISSEGIWAGAQEFQTGNYAYVIATGGLTGERWNTRRWNYAEVAEEQLLRAGVPRSRVLLAPSRDSETQRTYQMALSAQEALHAHGLEPRGINVFTRGAHARRSRLIFEKVMGRQIKVGVISWSPQDPKAERWWKSSERAEDLIKETVGVVFEVFLNSGRPLKPSNGAKALSLTNSAESTPKPDPWPQR